MKTTRPKAAAVARIGAALGRRKRAELLGLLRPCFARTEPWLQAGKYAAAVMSDLRRQNGWTIAAHAGDRTPDKTQRLLNRARPPAAGTAIPVQAARCGGWQRVVGLLPDRPCRDATDNVGRPLQAETPLDTSLIHTYDVPPYVNSADQSGAVPFLDIGNHYVLAGAQYTPQLLAGLSAAQIARQLSNPASPVAKAIDGSARVIIAAIDQVLQNKTAPS